MSFRMSKDLAQRISGELTKKKTLEIVKLRKELDKWAIAEYEKTIPAAVKRVFKQFPGYINRTENFRVFGTGFSSSLYVSIPKELPEHASHRGLNLTGELAVKFKQMQNHIETLELNRNELRTEIEAALVGLNSFAKIQKDFPEAVPFIPVSTSQALMINMDKLREKIKTA